MKAIYIIQIGLLIIGGAVTSAQAQTSDQQIAELTQKVAMLERQNLSLKAAIEQLAGKPLEQLLTSGTTSLHAAGTATAAPSAPDPQKLAAIAVVKRRIADLETKIKGPQGGKRDPFSDLPEAPKLKLSKADQEKALQSDLRTLDALQQQLAAMETALAGN